MINSRHEWQSTQVSWKSSKWWLTLGGVQERVDELTGKISVKKRDNESIFKKQQEAMDKNEGLGL